MTDMSERARALEQALRAIRATLQGVSPNRAVNAAAEAWSIACATLAVDPPPSGASPQAETEEPSAMGAGSYRRVQRDEELIRFALSSAVNTLEEAGCACQPEEPCAMCLCKEAVIHMMESQPAPVSTVEPSPNDALLRDIRTAAAMGLSFGHQATPQPMERMVERKDKRLRQILTLLAEHGVTGSMLRVESNAAVEPEPPTEIKRLRDIAERAISGWSDADKHDSYSDDIMAVRYALESLPTVERAPSSKAMSHAESAPAEEPHP